MKNYNYKGLVRQSFYTITRALENNKNLAEIKQEIRNLVNSYQGLTRNERSDLYQAIYRVARAANSSSDWDKTLSLRRNYDSVLAASRRVYASQNLRIKKNVVRANSGTIFFLCSKHNSSADDHKDYQGKIYVDRFWRTKVSGKEYAAVLDFIKNNDVKTVQDIMGAPVYLTTRPYCKHFFIPLATEDIVDSVLPKEDILEEYHAKHRTKLYDADDYYELRSSIYDGMNNIHPCKYFDNKKRGD